MSWNVEIRADLRLVVTRFDGAVDYEDFHRWLEEAPRAAGFCREYDGVIDVRQATYKQARPEKVQLLASQMIEKNFTTGRWAVIVSGPTSTALSLHYQKKAAVQHPMQVVSTPEAAAHFLNRLPEEIASALMPWIALGRHLTRFSVHPARVATAPQLLRGNEGFYFSSALATSTANA